MFDFRLILYFVWKASLLIEISDNNNIASDLETKDCAQCCLRFTQFMINEMASNDSSKISSERIPITIRLLLETDANGTLSHILGLIRYIKNYRLWPTLAATAVDIMDRSIVHHPEIRDIFSKEFKLIETNIRQEVRNSDDNEKVMVIKKIESLLIEPLDVSKESNDSSNENGLEKMMNTLCQHFVKYKTPYVELAALAKMLNSMVGANFKLPTTKYVLLKEMKRKARLNSSIYVLCNNCKEFTKNEFFSEDKYKCERCSREIRSRNNTSFIYIDLKDQLLHMLMAKYEKIMSFLQQIRRSSDTIDDVYDGDLLQNVFEKNECFLSLTINSDGVSYENSNTKSVWPLQIICNFLPPEIRFHEHNILLVGLYYGLHKPEFNKFLFPLCQQMEILQTTGLWFNNINFKVYITHATFDLPAKAQIQQMQQYNGYFGCGYCYHPGVSIVKGVRYPSTTDNNELRCTEKHMKEVHISSGQSLILNT